MSIAPLDAGFAELLKQPRSAYVSRMPDGIQVLQTGGAYIGDSLSVPTTPYELTDGEAAIETFVCGPNQPVVATGDDDRLIELWSPFAQVVSDAVYAAAFQFDIALEGPGYLTASALPLTAVSHEPHFDDDQFTPTDGVSIVATVSTHGGTRCTTTAIDLPFSPSGAPISVPQALQNDFDSGRHPHVEGEQGRLLVLPQFGQLHSGPNLEDLDPGTLRTLFVFRSRTASTVVAAPRRRHRSA